MIAPELVTLGILAGGRATRLGGIDKAFATFQGESLLARTLRAFPQPFAERLLSYNRTPCAPMPRLRLVRDLRAGHLGPLAALEALFVACKTPWLLSVPVDMRDWPPMLAGELLQLAEQGAVVVSDADGLQPLIGLWNMAALRESVAAALDSGERAVHRWVATQVVLIHDISPLRLGNLNSTTDFSTH